VLHEHLDVAERRSRGCSRRIVNTDTASGKGRMMVALEHKLLYFRPDGLTGELTAISRTQQGGGTIYDGVTSFPHNYCGCRICVLC
jgi:hypothetical protein